MVLNHLAMTFLLSGLQSTADLQNSHSAPQNSIEAQSAPQPPTVPPGSLRDLSPHSVSKSHTALQPKCPQPPKCSTVSPSALQSTTAPPQKVSWILDRPGLYKDLKLHSWPSHLPKPHSHTGPTNRLQSPQIPSPPTSHSDIQSHPSLPTYQYMFFIPLLLFAFGFGRMLPVPGLKKV